MNTICIAGKNSIAVNALHWLLQQPNASLEVVVCTNKNDDGVNGWQPSLKQAALKKSIRIVKLDELYDIENLFFFSLEFDRIIKPQLFKSQQLFNIHFSYLPEYKGMYTSILPLLHGKSHTGVTLHRIDKGIDTGDIIDQEKILLLPVINSREVYDHYLQQSFSLFTRNFQNLLTGNYTAIAQPAENSTYFSRVALDYSNITIDINKTSWEIHNQVRAFAFRDYQLPKVYNSIIYRSEMLEEPSVAKPGTVVTENKYYLVMETIDYRIKLYKDQLTILLDACASGNLALVQEIAANHFPLHTKNSKGWDALIVAAYNEQQPVCQWLLQNGFDVNTKNYKGTTALMYAMTAASSSGRKDVVNTLMDYKPDMHAKDDAEKNIMQYARQYGNADIIDLLTGKIQEA